MSLEVLINTLNGHSNLNKQNRNTCQFPSPLSRTVKCPSPLNANISSFIKHQKNQDKMKVFTTLNIYSMAFQEVGFQMPLTGPLRG